MPNEPKRKCELFFCAALTDLLPGAVFLPEKGGNDDPSEPIDPRAGATPPYTVVSVDDDLERMIPGENTWLATVRFTVVNHINAASGAAHSRLVRQVLDAIGQIERGVYPDQQIVLHGIEISGVPTIQDDEAKGFGDVITASVGFSG